MELFHVIDDAVAILRSKGVFRQVPVYRRGEEVFAKHGSGFIKLLSAGHTTQPNISWIDVATAEVKTVPGPSGLRIVETVAETSKHRRAA